MPSGTAVTLQLPAGAAVGGPPFTVSPGGLRLLLLVPPGLLIDHLRLELAAAEVREDTLTPVAISTDAGPVAGGAVRWIEAQLPHEVVLTGLRLDGADPASTGARVKLLSRGVWMPLPPVDTIAIGAQQALPAVVASRVLAELLVPVAERSPVRVPGSAVVTGMALTGTSQACHVAVAVGEDPPFFTHPGPLPSDGIAVDGLLRAVSRYRLDRPEVDSIPLRLTAAGPAEVIVSLFEAALGPPPPARPVVPQPGAGEPQAETVWLQPVTLLALGRAQLCDAGHVVAQGFDALPLNRLLSSLDLHVGAELVALSATVAIHADAGGIPAATAVTGGAMTLTQPARPTPLAGVIPCRPAQPLSLSEGAWWLVCDVRDGECLWLVGGPRPTGVGRTLSRTIGGEWLPAPATLIPASAGDPGWAQAVLRTVPAGPWPTP